MLKMISISLSTALFPEAIISSWPLVILYNSDVDFEDLAKVTLLSTLYS